MTKKEQLPSKASKCDGSKATTCKHCGLTLHLRDREGDICLQCLASLRPHTTYHENTYSIIEGCIRQSTDNPIEKTNNERRKPIQHTNQPTQ
jgi:hypothetical protein